jgi:NAD/NADP transhydrogenase beta subunit
MGMGLLIDNAGWFALLLVLVALSALTHPEHRRRWIWALPLALAVVLIGVLIPAMNGSMGDLGWKAWLVVAALAFGVAAAPWYRGSRDRDTRLIDLVQGVSIMLIGSGLTLTLLGLIGWDKTILYVHAWDLRLAALIGIFIGIWSTIAGLIHWLRLKGTIPGSASGSRNQRIAQWAVLGIIVILGAIATFYPQSATAPLILMIVLAIEWAALGALQQRQEDLVHIQARLVGLLGVAIVTLGYVQSSLLLLVVGGLVMAGSIHFVRHNGAFCQISRRDFYSDESPDAFADAGADRDSTRG